MERRTFLSYFSGKQQKNLDDVSLSHNKAGVTASRRAFFRSHTLLQFQRSVRHAGDTPPPLFVRAGAGVDIHTGAHVDIYSEWGYN